MINEIPFTKDEFRIALEVQAKATEQMVIIASSLKEITIELKEVHDRLTNGAVQEIVEGVTNNYHGTHRETIKDLSSILSNQEKLVEKIKECQECRPEVYNNTLKNSVIAKDIEHVKWFIGIVGIVVIVTMIIIRIMNLGAINNQEKVIAHMFREHAAETHK